MFTHESENVREVLIIIMKLKNCWRSQAVTYGEKIW